MRACALLLVAGIVSCCGATKPNGVPVRVPLYTSCGSFVPYLHLGLGTPEQKVNVLFDIGSPMFWARTKIVAHGLPCHGPAYDPVKSTTALNTEMMREFGYGSGVIHGVRFMDKMTMGTDGGPVAVPNIPVASTHRVIGMECSDGLLGADMNSTTMPVVLDALRLPRILSLTFHMASCPGEEQQVNGYMIFGGVDHTSYTGGLHCVKMLPWAERLTVTPAYNPQNARVNNTKWWMFAVDSAHVGGKRAGAPVQAFVDTGCTALVLPEPISKAIGTVDPSCSNYSSMPELVITIKGGQKIILGPEQYIYKSEGVCNMLVEYDPQAPKHTLILGDPYYFKYVTAFDYENEQIAIGLKTGVKGDAMPQTCSRPIFDRSSSYRVLYE